MAAFYKPSLSDDYSQLETPTITSQPLVAMKTPITGKYKIQGGKKEPLYYQFDWECSAVMDKLPNDYRPAAAFRPDGTVYMVRDVLVSGGYKDLCIGTTNAHIVVVIVMVVAVELIPQLLKTL